MDGRERLERGVCIGLMKGDVTTGQLRIFGLGAGGISVAFGAAVMFKERYVGGLILVTAGALLLLFGAWAPRYLTRIYTYWMAAAEKIGWINTRILLFVVYYLVITPTGVGMRLFGRDPMGRKKDARGSYWRYSGKDTTKESYERQF